MPLRNLASSGLVHLLRIFAFLLYENQEDTPLYRFSIGSGPYTESASVPYTTFPPEKLEPAQSLTSAIPLPVDVPSFKRSVLWYRVATDHPEVLQAQHWLHVCA